MRMEDWQKWLDSQFLDEEPQPAPVPQYVEPEPIPQSVAPEPQVWTQPEPEPALPAPSLPVAEPPVAEPPAPAPAVYVPPQQPVAQTTQQPDAPATRRPSESPAPLRSEMESDDVDIPTIENYLPFLRPKAPPAPAPAAVVEPPPVPVEPIAEAGPPSAEPEPVPEPVVLIEPEPVPPTEVPPAEAAPDVAVDDGAAPEVTVEGGAVDQGDLDVAVGVSAEQETLLAEEPPAPQPRTRPVVAYRRVRAARNPRPTDAATPLTSEELWALTPRHLETLLSMGDDTVAQNSYKRGFKESRIELIERLLDPTLSLEETARLLNVCPTTVRRYTNRGQLRHLRTEGDQRRFKLSDVLAFMESQSRTKARTQA